jgi:protein-L-isoaspartate(D-aspartate) O-methyltransferase
MSKRFRYIIKYSILALMSSLLLISCRTSPQQPTITDTPTEISGTGSDPRTAERENMVKFSIENRDVSDPDVLAAMRSVPRHLFVLEPYQGLAYADQPLPIGYGQTISQPYIVALMTEALDLKKGDRVLEIGTGSGYQAAILAEMGMEVYTIEIIPELEASAKAQLAEMEYVNVQTRNADGYFGWEEEAPFDAVIVTAAPDHLPQPLIQQLADGGRMVVPIGPIGAVQTLWLFSKQGEDLVAKNLGPVSFVPFTGDH